VTAYGPQLGGQHRFELVTAQLLHQPGCDHDDRAAGPAYDSQDGGRVIGHQRGPDRRGADGDGQVPQEVFDQRKLPGADHDRALLVEGLGVHLPQLIGKELRGREPGDHQAQDWQAGSADQPSPQRGRLVPQHLGIGRLRGDQVVPRQGPARGGVVEVTGHDVGVQVGDPVAER